jgi:hypothetical protein
MPWSLRAGGVARLAGAARWRRDRGLGGLLQARVAQDQHHVARGRRRSALRGLDRRPSPGDRRDALPHSLHAASTDQHLEYGNFRRVRELEAEGRMLSASRTSVRTTPRVAVGRLLRRAGGEPELAAAQRARLEQQPQIVGVPAGAAGKAAHWCVANAKRDARAAARRADRRLLGRPTGQTRAPPASVCRGRSQLFPARSGFSNPRPLAHTPGVRIASALHRALPK